MNSSDLSVVYSTGFAILIAFIIGIILCLYFWFKDLKSSKEGSLNKFRWWVFLWGPLTLSVLFFLFPKAETMQSLLGKSVFDIYSVISIAIITYVVPALFSGGVILLMNKHRNKWIFASIPFISGIVFISVRLLQIYNTVKGN